MLDHPANGPLSSVPVIPMQNCSSSSRTYIIAYNNYDTMLDDIKNNTFHMPFSNDQC